MIQSPVVYFHTLRLTITVMLYFAHALSLKKIIVFVTIKVKQTICKSLRISYFQIFCNSLQQMTIGQTDDGRNKEINLFTAYYFKADTKIKLPALFSRIIIK